MAPIAIAAADISTPMDLRTDEIGAGWYSKREYLGRTLRVCKSGTNNIGAGGEGNDPGTSGRYGCVAVHRRSRTNINGTRSGNLQLHGHGCRRTRAEHDLHCDPNLALPGCIASICGTDVRKLRRYSRTRTAGNDC